MPDPLLVVLPEPVVEPEEVVLALPVVEPVVEPVVGPVVGPVVVSVLVEVLPPTPVDADVESPLLPLLQAARTPANVIATHTSTTF